MTKRGRPRTPATMARDDAILARLKDGGPATRNALATELDFNPVHVWLSLDRLYKEGKVDKARPQAGQGHGLLWRATGRRR
jgi:predicted ArsR family transcriptional regulator